MSPSTNMETSNFWVQSGSRDKLPKCRFCLRRPNKMQGKRQAPKNTRFQPRILSRANNLSSRESGKKVTHEQFKKLRGKHMRKTMSCLSSTVLLAVTLLAQVASASDQTKDDERLRNSGAVLKEILD